VSPRELSARTAVYGVAGDPIAQSLSPALHMAAFEAMGVDAVSVAFRTGADDAATVVDALRRLGVRGLSVTMPLKSRVLEHCDEVTEGAARIGSANCLVRGDDGTVRAETTDGAGLLAAISCVTGRGIAGLSCAVLGAGGAARAAIAALCDAGAREVVVVARRPDAAEAAAALGTVARRGTPPDAAGAAVVVQATPVGMQGSDAENDTELLDGGALGDGQIAVELVYHPRVTPWLARAGSAGATCVPGVEVLVHQAALALELWLGAPPPTEGMHLVVGAR